MKETRTCKKCGLVKYPSHFSLSSRAKSGLQTYCKECQSKGNSVYRANNFEKRREIEKKSAAKYPNENVYRVLAQRSKKKNIALMPQDDFIDWYKAQERNCAYCGITEDHAKVAFKHRLHVDRIENAKGYVTGNVILACQRCNLIKNGYLTHQQMMEVAGRYFNGPHGNSHYELVEALSVAKIALCHAHSVHGVFIRKSLFSSMDAVIAKATGEA